MAKKSAKSKGYRKQIEKKPYLSKKEIAILCVALVAVGIAAFFLFRYDDGALKVQDGAVVAGGDNWLIVNGSNARGRARYYKLGEIGEIDGFSREKGAISTDPNVPQYVFTAEAEEGDIDTVTVTSSHVGAESLAKYASEMMSAMDGAEVSEPRSAQLNGREAHYYLRTLVETPEEAGEGEAAPEGDAETDTEGTEAEATDESGEATEAGATDESDEATEAGATDESSEATEAGTTGESGEAAEAASGSASRAVSGYIDAGHDSCIVLLVESNGQTAEDCASDEALLVALEQAIAAVTLEE